MSSKYPYLGKIDANLARNKHRLPPWVCLVADYIYANAGVEAGDVDNDN